VGYVLAQRLDSWSGEITCPALFARFCALPLEGAVQNAGSKSNVN